MIVEVGTREKKKKVTTCKTMREFFKWFDNYIKGKVHWYTRVNFLENGLEVDYGDYTTFIYLSDLPDNWKEDLTKIQLEKQQERNKKL